MGVSVVTPAASYPVTLAEAKQVCKVDGTARDSEITGMIAAATEYAEKYTGHSIVTQTLKLTLDEFSDSILLPRGPVQSVTNVKYYDTAGVEQTVSASDYTTDLINDPAWVVRNATASWPTTLDAVNVVSVTYVAGYATIPEPIKWGILLWVSAVLDNQAIPAAFEHLLTNYRSFGA
jgi:uncharacterized phiE125 gp8 family phage protein